VRNGTAGSAEACGATACYRGAMFGLSFTELLIIAVLALILLGPDKLPDAMKTVGKGLREFQKATQDLKDQIEGEIYADERKASKPALVPPVPTAASSPGRPTDPQGPPPAATADNVPGLEAALAEPTAPRAEQAPAPEAKSP
jgi:sec-independent protein translocase protein TatB